MMEIRPASASDARSVAQVHVYGWQAAYRGIVPDSHLDSLSVDERESIWHELIVRGSPELWVAETAQKVAGWASFDRSRDLDAGLSVGELQAIYVAPEYWGTGIGRSLWSVARRRLMESGFHSATLWVLKDNARAIRFYRAAGFVPNPAMEKEISVGGKRLLEVRYEIIFD